MRASVGCSSEALADLLLDLGGEGAAVLLRVYPQHLPRQRQDPRCGGEPRQPLLGGDGAEHLRGDEPRQPRLDRARLDELLEHLVVHRESLDLRRLPLRVPPRRLEPPRSLTLFCRAVAEQPQGLIPRRLGPLVGDDDVGSLSHPSVRAYPVPPAEARRRSSASRRRLAEVPADASEARRGSGASRRPCDGADERRGDHAMERMNGAATMRWSG